MTVDETEFEDMRLERLPVKEFVRRLIQMPAKKRLETILQSPEAGAVISQLAEQDFYFFVKEVGPHDALPLLGLASMDQLNHLFDLDWWQKDSVLPAKAVEWLEWLARASEEKLLAWLYQVDFELLVTLFKKWLTVSLIPEDEDPLEVIETLPKHTLDDQYFWESRYPQYEDFFKNLLSLIFEVHYGFYKELMNHIVVASDVELEEEAYRFHRGRLEDRAIPDYYDSLEIYRFLDVEEATTSKTASSYEHIQGSTPSFALALLPEADLLSRALLEIEDFTLLSCLQFELASLANKVVVADRLSPDNPETLRDAVDKVAGYVNLGLEMKSDGIVKRAVQVLGRVFLEHLFRLGHTQVARLKGSMQRVLEKGWLSQWPAGLKCLDPDWMEAAELLLARTPRLLRSGPEIDSSARECLFRSQGDLLEAKRRVDVIEALEPLFHALQARPERLDISLWQEGQISELEDVTLGAMIWTMAARFLSEGKWVLEPIPVALWPELFPVLKPSAMEEVILSWVNGVVPDPTRRELVGAYLQPLFTSYEHETASFMGGRPPDARLVHSFLFKQGP